MACGPPKATTMAGMVMKGPMPHIWDMLMAVACVTPIRRRRCGGCETSMTTSPFTSQTSVLPPGTACTQHIATTRATSRAWAVRHARAGGYDSAEVGRLCVFTQVKARWHHRECSALAPDRTHVADSRRAAGSGGRDAHAPTPGPDAGHPEMTPHRPVTTRSMP